jgi:hypothetical protein
MLGNEWGCQQHRSIIAENPADPFQNNILQELKRSAFKPMDSARLENGRRADEDSSTRLETRRK